MKLETGIGSWKLKYGNLKLETENWKLKTRNLEMLKLANLKPGNMETEFWKTRKLETGSWKVTAGN